MACGLHDKRNELIDWKDAYRLSFECTRTSKRRVFDP